MAKRLQTTARWLRWLTPGLEIKRWLLLLMVAELVLVLGAAYALKELYQTATLPYQFYYITLQFWPYWARAAVFGVLGVGLLAFSYLKLTQSVLGPFLPGVNAGSIVEVIHAFRLRGRGPRIVASTLQDVTLVASINGSNVEGESKIPKQNGRISQVFLKPDGAQVNPEATQAILAAELIVIGPGSLYTSILPNLLVEGMVEAIKASPALKLLVCNLASQSGETDGYGVDDYLHVVRDHVGSNLFDFVLVNSNHSHMPTGGQSQVVFRPEDATQHPEVRFIAADVVNIRIPSHHDPDKLARVIMRKVWQA